MRQLRCRPRWIHIVSVGTRSFISSDQFSAKLISAGAALAELLQHVILRNGFARVTRYCTYGRLSVRYSAMSAASEDASRFYGQIGTGPRFAVLT